MPKKNTATAPEPKGEGKFIEGENEPMQDINQEDLPNLENSDEGEEEEGGDNDDEEDPDEYNEEAEMNMMFPNGQDEQ